MSAVIKSTDAAALSVRAFTGAPARSAEIVTAEPVVSVELLSLRREVESLTQRLGQRDGDVERLKSDVGRAFREGEAEGRKTGLKEADERRAEALASLESGVRQALSEFSDACASLERLAALLAHEGLGKVLDPTGPQTDLVRQVIHRRMEEIDARGLIRIEVSRQDFAEQAELDMLARSLGRSQLEIRACDELEAGECQFKLTLGTLEVGVGQQWGRLSDLLHELAAPGERP